MMNRSRREIKTPKRFDDEPFQAPRETPTPAKVVIPKVESSGFKVSLPKKKKLVETPQPKEHKPAPPPPPPPSPLPLPLLLPLPLPLPLPPPPPLTPLELAIPPKIHRLPKEYRPPKERTLAYEALVPNVVLPFWDARTAAEEHEDDNVKELVHCQCGMAEELGLMVQCETCLTWQHAHCLGIDKEEDAPDGYSCQACTNPRFARESTRWAYDQDWLVKGRMKRFSCDKSPLDTKSVEGLSKINRLIEDTLKAIKLLHSLRVKARLLRTGHEDDPELKLFRLEWPADQQQPIVADQGATPDTCKANLRRHILQLEEYVGEELERIQRELEVFETEIPTVKYSFESLRRDLQIMRFY